MVVTTLSTRTILKKATYVIKLLVLVFILFYVLPKLLILFWDAIRPVPDIQDQRLMENPLRVLAKLLKFT